MENVKVLNHVGCPICKDNNNLRYELVNGKIHECHCSCGELGGPVFWVDLFDIIGGENITCAKDGSLIFPEYTSETLTYKEMLEKYPKLILDTEKMVGQDIDGDVDYGF